MSQKIRKGREKLAHFRAVALSVWFLYSAVPIVGVPHRVIQNDKTIIVTHIFILTANFAYKQGDFMRSSLISAFQALSKRQGILKGHSVSS
jgi:hypothetical protein